MSSDNNIKKYTAIDIEKYHKGRLSPKEMNELEKAALDDPFLSDALEGYATIGVNIGADIAELKNRLNQKTVETKVIPINIIKQKKIPWMKIAAILVLIGGAGILTYKFSFTKKETAISGSEVAGIDKTGSSDSVKNTATAQNEKKETNSIVGPDSGKTEKNININTLVSAKQKIKDEEAGVLSNPENEIAGITTDQARKHGETVDDDAKSVTTPGQIAKEAAPVLSEETRFKESKKLNAAAAPNAKTDILVPGTASDQPLKNLPVKIFHGRVTDTHKVGVPFANVTNPADNTGTYTDANGYFNLTYPDSVLKVQVRSIGFENSLVQLKNKETTNLIILVNDSTSLSEVVIGNKLPNTAMRSRDANRTLEQPEPADGWVKYDTYLANNLNPPGDYKPKSAVYPSVEVSFEINNNGEPVNIKIEKSLCAKCDKEAIRLIKEGPKWKQNASKNGRTRVIINF